MAKYFILDRPSRKLPSGLPKNCVSTLFTGDRFREHLRDVEKNDKDTSKPVASAAFPYIKVRRKAARIWNKNSSSKSAPLILTILTNAFHLTNVFLFFTLPCYTKSKAPTSMYVRQFRAILQF